ncbi:MAG TPA: ArsA family ATPase [Lapillicoccus sp.]|nr:ArsA family ATPase [Lapillicoccus sp.]
MRIVLFTGKGGVGKTTTAAACAVRAARSGTRTLVMSTDAAHSLGDALGVPLAADGPVEVEPRLHALQVSAPGQVGTEWRVVQDYLLEVLDTVGIDPVVAEELTSLPGAEEIAALLELRTRAASGEWDLIVVDCAPTAETLRLLALPEALAWHLERLLPAQRGIMRTLRPAAAAAAGMPLPSAQVASTVSGWYRQMRDVHALLTGPAASVRLVLTPERVVIAEARRTWTSLGLFGFAVDGVVVNRVIPAAETGRGDAWRRSWNAAQQAGLDEVAESFAGLPTVRLPYLAAEPIGPDALDDLAGRIEGEVSSSDDPLGVLGPVRHEGLRVRRSGSGYVLSLPLPLVEAREVGLKRRDTELLVTVGDHRRVLSLPAVLQRCVVRGARVREGTLRVTFEPDPDLWPVQVDAPGSDEGMPEVAHG